jgi:tetratricopeptide (TPR) repeat protein
MKVHRPDVTPVQEKLARARHELSAALIERDDEVDLVLTALVAREHALLVSPPGCGKSLLLDALLAWAGGSRFSILLTKFTVPEEVFGPVSLAGLKDDRYVRVTAGKLPEAAAALEKAVQASPRQAVFHNQLGITYRMTGDFAKAKASYERSISLDGTYAPAVLNLGVLYDLYLWDGARALELYDRYLQLTPGGDDQVKRWVSDLRNRTTQKSAPQRKEQG